jgi:hypothetical protein
MQVPFDGLIESEGARSIDARQVGIQQHLLAAHGDDQ